MGPLETKPQVAAFQELSAPGLPTWAGRLKQCLDAGSADPTSRYAQLATVDSDGRPHVRTIVMRGCMGELTGPDAEKAGRLHFWIITDRRSAKLTEIQHQPAVEIAWYFGATRQQFRLAGQMHYDLSADSEIRQNAWARISTPAKVQFYWPEPLQPRDPFQSMQFQVHENPDHFAASPDSFVVMSLEVMKVDHLILNGNPQDRFIWLKDETGQWHEQEVNP